MPGAIACRTTPLDVVCSTSTQNGLAIVAAKRCERVDLDNDTASRHQHCIDNTSTVYTDEEARVSHELHLSDSSLPMIGEVFRGQEAEEWPYFCCHVKKCFWPIKQICSVQNPVLDLRSERGQGQVSDAG